MKIIDGDTLKLLASIILSIGLVLFMLVCGCITSFTITRMLWERGGQFVNQPKGDILATAEYLYNNPLPTPSRFTHMNEGSNQSMCIWVAPQFTMGEDFFSRWFLNGERVPSERYNFSTELGIGCLPLQEALPGLHLVEIQLYDNPFYRTLSYQWAIKIDPTPIP